MLVKRLGLLAAVSTVLALALSSGLVSTSAAAEDKCQWDPGTQREVCEVQAGDDDTVPGATNGKRSKRQPVCFRLIVYPPGAKPEVPCVSDDGIWIQQRQCYAKPKDPQPGKGDPVWGDHSNGAVYSCITDIPYYRNESIWLQNPPQQQVDPEVVARQVVRSMGLAPVQIGMAPRPGPDSRGLVGLPVYMWVADAGPATIGPMSRSATSAGVTVTATATVQQIRWDMGDGTVVTCHGAGTPYQDSYGSAPSPTCGHTYRHASAGRGGGAYPVTATSYWHVDWSGGGQNGFFEFSLSTRTTVRISESQALN